MKLSMWIINDWLEKYAPKPRITNGEMTIHGVRFLSDDIELQNEFLYIGYLDSHNHNIICVNNTDIITLTAPDIYVIFNEIQQMLEFYGNWETSILQAINKNIDLDEILSMTLPLLKSGIALTDLSHKILGSVHYQEIPVPETHNNYLSANELQVINEQIRKKINAKEPYVIRSLATPDIVRNFYSVDGKLIGWFVALGGGRNDHLNSRMQIAEAFCSLMDLWFRINVGNPLYSNLFLDIMEMRETDPASIALRMEGLGWPYLSEMSVIVLKSVSDDALGVSVISRYLENSFSGIFDFIYQSQYVLLINYDLTDEKEFLKSLIKLLKSQNAYCGFSYSFSDPIYLKQYYAQALCALEFGCNEAGSVNYCKDYVLDYMRSHFRNSLEVNIISPVLKQLKLHDQENGTDYYNTLKVYLSCERDQTLAARVLCIHRNSLVYRINRLKEMLDVDLDNYNERLFLILSYFLADA